MLQIKNRKKIRALIKQQRGESIDRRKLAEIFQVMDEKSTFGSIARRVCRQISGNKDWRKHAEDCAFVICELLEIRYASQGVSGFIYYTETIPFGKRVMADFTEYYINDFGEQDFGRFMKQARETGEIFNAVAWAALKSVAFRIQDIVEE